MPSPRAPFDRWPTHVFDPAFGYAWYARPAVYVTQAHIDTGTLAAAHVVQSWMDELLRTRDAEIRAAGGLFVFHDWSTVGGYTSEARQHYLARMRARPRDYLRHSVTCIRPSPLFRMAVEAGNLVAALTARAKVELASDPAAALAAHRIGAPKDGRFAGVER
jgi:hypothetical protein